MCAHRRPGIARLPAGVGEMLALAPVERRRDRLALDPVPPVRQPQRGGAVAAVGDELLPLAVADEPPGERERLEQHAVRAGLRCRTRSRRPGGRSARCRRDARASRAPCRRRRAAGSGAAHIAGPSGFWNSACLMSVSSSSWCCCSCAMPSSISAACAGSAEQRLDRLVDMRAPVEDLGQRRARQHAAPRRAGCARPRPRSRS